MTIQSRGLSVIQLSVLDQGKKSGHFIYATRLVFKVLVQCMLFSTIRDSGWPLLNRQNEMSRSGHALAGTLVNKYVLSFSIRECVHRRFTFLIFGVSFLC